MQDLRKDLSKTKDNLTKEDIETQKSKYPKKSFEELISLLKQKGVKFNIVSEEKALNVLRDINYYYKLTVYKRNFKRYDSGTFKNLEFSYLMDLASVDMQLRYILLTASLDIEHALKTFLMAKITNNKEEDGFEIVRRFFHSTINSQKPLNKDNILKSLRHKNHYQYKLYEAHKKAPPAWVLMEVIGFGDFLRFFEFYFKKNPIEEFEINSLMGVLHSVRRIRNASAHNNAFLFDLHISNIENASRYLRQYAEKIGIGKLFYECNKIHDLMSVFYAHERFVKGQGSRHHRIQSFKNLTIKSIERFSYMDKNNDILHFFKILNTILDKYEI